MLSRRKVPKMGVRERPQIRCPSHLKWVRGFPCSAENQDCMGNIEAAHVRSGTDGGKGVKPSDTYAIPLCNFHHARQHAIGEKQFERETGINMRSIADELARRSPHKHKWMEKV